MCADQIGDPLARSDKGVDSSGFGRNRQFGRILDMAGERRDDLCKRQRAFADRQPSAARFADDIQMGRNLRMGVAELNATEQRRIGSRDVGRHAAGTVEVEDVEQDKAVRRSGGRDDAYRVFKPGDRPPAHEFQIDADAEADRQFAEPCEGIGDTDTVRIVSGDT